MNNRIDSHLLVIQMVNVFFLHIYDRGSSDIMCIYKYV